MLKINEIFYSIQGESSMIGLPCVFVRLTFCNLRCSYCDTEYAFYEGEDMSVEEIIAKVESFGCKLIEITGGEPLLQPEVKELMTRLCDAGYSVMLETGGGVSLRGVDDRVLIIMDIKTPDSKMEKKNLYENIGYLKKNDEIKFVISSENDYLWSKEIINKYDLINKCKVLMGGVFGQIEPKSLVAWILRDNLKVRFQIQIHKYIWDPNRKGV